MVDQNKPQENIEAPLPERKISATEQSVHFGREKKERVERNNMREDKLVSDELKRELDLMQQDENLKKDANIELQKVEFLGEKDKIEHLLKVAREKGLVYAINLARNMNEPYLLDVLHDTLAREGYYKDFIPGSSNTQKDDDN